MVFSYNWLQSFFREKLPKPEELAGLLTMHSFEVSGVEKVENDFALDIDVLPNRAPDCFSHLGIAREIAAITGLKWRGLTPPIKEDREIKAKDFVVVEVKNKLACPRYTARVITEVKVGPSPKWLRERLEVCGLRPINNIVDIANYVMLETGQPLHAFDFDKISPTNYEFERITNKKLIVRFAKEGEKIVTLDEKKYDLEENILVIADAKKPIAIAGIKGGKETGVDSKTKMVVLESANFNPRVIRQASKLIDLKTDASWRFEHGLDPNLTEFAINRAASLIEDIANGKVAQGLVDFYPKKVLPKKIKLDFDYIENLLGVKIPLKKVIKILKDLNFKVTYQLTSLKTYQLFVEVPTFRLDISISEDLIEEIGRIYGYQKIPSNFPMAALIPPKRNLDIFWEDITKDILKEVGFSEVYNYSFISQKDAEIFKYKREELIEIENPISLEFQYLRPSLIPNLLKNVEKNFRNFGEIKIFELGKIFTPLEKLKHNRKSNFSDSLRGFKKGFKEKRALTGVMTGQAPKENKFPTGQVFFEAKGVIDLLLNKLGISNIWYDDYKATPEESKISIWHPKKSAEIKVNGEEIGFLGEISPEILERMKVENRVVAFDIDFEKLTKLASEETIYRPISPYPAAIRDIAILVPHQVRVEEVLNKIEITGGKLVKDVDLFDIYEGEEIPAGKKNLAFRIIYQAEDHTLTSDEIDKIQQKIIKTLEREPEWQVRK